MIRNNKKPFIILLVSVIAVFVVGTITTTYAWFLSRYSREYAFELESDSNVIIKYETQLNFASGDEHNIRNALVPATAKRTDGIAQAALSPLDVFDVDISPAHTGVVAQAAHAVKFTAEGAYWTGNDETVGKFSFSLEAYLSTVNSRVANGANDLAGAIRGEIGYYLVLFYQGEVFLLYDDNYYILMSGEPGLGDNAVQLFDYLELTATDLGFEDANALYYWRAPTAGDDNLLDEVSGKQYLLLQPNTTINLNLYAFVAKTDEELDPAINGKNITLIANIHTIDPASEQQGGGE